MVGLEVDMRKNAFFNYMIGDGGFVGSFFDTIAVVLESGVRGKRFPIVNDLYYGEIIAGAKLKMLQDEFDEIKREFGFFPPSKAVWNMEDPHEKAPWGDNISPEITDLSNYFVTYKGQSIFDVLNEAVNHAIRIDTTIKIFSTHER